MARAELSSPTRLRGVVELAGSGFEQITERIHALHRAISDLPFDRLRLLPVVSVGSQTTRTIHDGITDGVYASVRLAGGAAFRVAALTLKGVEGAARPAADPGEWSPGLEDVNGAINGVVGDFMAVRRNPLAVRAGFYVRGRRLRLTREELTKANPDATGRLAIFVHGLCCNEHCWWRSVEPDDPETRPYASRLAADLGFTPYFARYNTGLHVSQNGRLLAREIARLVQAHPVPVEELVLIGHSMGTRIDRLPGARYHFIGSSIRRSADDLLGRAIGDGLVRLPSSTACELAGADTAVLLGVSHLGLLNHPAVYREIARRLGAMPPT
jgi:hypothetical protein